MARNSRRMRRRDWRRWMCRTSSRCHRVDWRLPGSSDLNPVATGECQDLERVSITYAFDTAIHVEQRRDFLTHHQWEDDAFVIGGRAHQTYEMRVKLGWVAFGACHALHSRCSQS